MIMIDEDTKSILVETLGCVHDALETAVDELAEACDAYESEIEDLVDELDEEPDDHGDAIAWLRAMAEKVDEIRGLAHDADNMVCRKSAIGEADLT
jgi:hypothetical protein